MTLLCPCGETFTPANWQGEIQVLCDSCSALHREGRSAEAPSWVRLAQRAVQRDPIRRAESKEPLPFQPATSVWGSALASERAKAVAGPSDFRGQRG